MSATLLIQGTSESVFHLGVEEWRRRHGEGPLTLVVEGQVQWPAWGGRVRLMACPFRTGRWLKKGLAVRRVAYQLKGEGVGTCVIIGDPASTTTASWLAWRVGADPVIFLNPSGWGEAAWNRSALRAQLDHARWDLIGAMVTGIAGMAGVTVLVVINLVTGLVGSGIVEGVWRVQSLFRREGR